MHYEVETYQPYTPSRVVAADELAALFRPDRAPVFGYGDHGEDTLIVSVHDGFCTVSLLHDRTWFWMRETPDDELVEIQLCGQEAWVPAGAKVPHRAGLAALLLAHDVPRLLAGFRWREQ